MKQQRHRDVFCHRLKQARLAKSLSQKELGILIGIDEFVAGTRINRYEKGVHEADIETAYRLALVLEVPLGFLYTEDDYLADIIIGFKKLSKQLQKNIHNIIYNNLH